jgi:hypothetical protein
VVEPSDKTSLFLATSRNQQRNPKASLDLLASPCTIWPLFIGLGWSPCCFSRGFIPFVDFAIFFSLRADQKTASSTSRKQVLTETSGRRAVHHHPRSEYARLVCDHHSSPVSFPLCVGSSVSVDSFGCTRNGGVSERELTTSRTAGKLFLFVSSVRSLPHFSFILVLAVFAVDFVWKWSVGIRSKKTRHFTRAGGTEAIASVSLMLPLRPFLPMSTTWSMRAAPTSVGVVYRSQ